MTDVPGPTAAGAPEGAAPTDVSDAPPASHPNPLAVETLRLANRLHEITSKSGKADLAKLLAEEATRWKDPKVRVVVAGEIKRGKTSFINSLIGRPGLLPVDADVATSVHLAVGYAPQLRVEVVRRLDLGEEPERFEVPPEQLVDYASMQGDPLRRHGVTSVEVGVDTPILERGLVVIDTPGVGGMTRGHRDLALAALRISDALLFTTSAQEPVLRSELEFLAEAGERIDNVIILLTKVDVSAEWERMVEEDRRRIEDFARHLVVTAEAPDADEEAREMARRFHRVTGAPLLPVSGRLAEKGLARRQAGHLERGDELLARSGMGAVEAQMVALLHSREVVRLANILRVASLVLARLEGQERARVRVAEGDHQAVTAELAAKQERLGELVPKQARWRQRFATSVQRIQTEIARLVGREMSRIDKHYRNQIVAAGAKVQPVMETLATDLEQTFEAAWSNLSAELVERLDTAVRDLAAEFSLDDVALEFGDTTAAPDLGELGVADRIDTTAGKADMVQDGLPLMVSMVGGMFTAAYNPVGLIAAGPMAFARLRKRREVEVKQEYLRVVREATQLGRQELSGELSLRLIEARTAIEDRIDELLANRRADLEAERKELMDILKEDAPKQAALKDQAKKRLAELRRMSAVADDLRQQVDAQRGAPGGAPR